MEIRYKVMTNQFDFRLEMVRSAQKYGVSKMARLFAVSRPTVYKWVRRFDLERLSGLQDRSRRPHHSPNALDEKIRRPDRASEKKDASLWEAGRLHREFGVRACSETIQKVFRQEGLTRPRRSKRSKQRDLRAWKEANFEPLKYFQVDTADTPRLNLPGTRTSLPESSISVPFYLYVHRQQRLCLQSLSRQKVSIPLLHILPQE